MLAGVGASPASNGKRLCSGRPHLDAWRLGRTRVPAATSTPRHAGTCSPTAASFQLAGVGDEENGDLCGGETVYRAVPAPGSLSVGNPQQMCGQDGANLEARAGVGEARVFPTEQTACPVF